MTAERLPMRFECSWMDCAGEDEPEPEAKLEAADVLRLEIWDLLLDLRVRSSSFVGMLEGMMGVMSVGDLECERRSSSEGEV